MKAVGPAIEAPGISKRYGTTRALIDVDLAADAARAFGLLGPNGVGKATRVRILIRLLRPDNGTAKVAGFDVIGEASALRHVMGLTGQFAAIDDSRARGSVEGLWACAVDVSMQSVERP